MKDKQGRTIDYMRISITDRCNLRCRYCMPEGIECVPRHEILSLEEILEITEAAADLGICHIKITGGEPLVRKDCCQLIAKIKKLPGIDTVTITTNGMLLSDNLNQLIAAGIDGINISLDTLDAGCYQELTGRGRLDQVLKGLEEAAASPVPVKINAVSLELGDQNWKELLNIPRRMPVDLRFIEMMPIGYGKNFRSMDHSKLLEKLQRLYPEMKKDERRHGYGPAVYYQIPGFQGAVGLISAIHGKFCGSCNRIRLTSQGYLKACLCYEDGADLKQILRDSSQEPGETARQLRQAIAEVIEAKPGAHCFEHPQDITEAENMISIGG